MLRIVVRTALVLACCAWPAVRAADVVEFADGRYLEVISHRVQGELVRLEVDGGSYMVIPVEQIDSIRRNRVVVFRAGAPRNEAVPALTESGPSERSVPAPHADSRLRFVPIAVGS